MDIYIYQNMQGMLNAIFSIKPEYVERIFSGEKKYEFRTTICKKTISKIIIYETSPISKIVGEVSVVKILKNTPSNIWKIASLDAGIEYDSFLKYFSNREYAYAYVLKNPIQYNRQFSLKELNISVAPQNFLYIDDEILKSIGILNV